MSEKPHIAVLILGGTMSFFRDERLNAEFPIKTKEELLDIFPQAEENAHIEVYSDIIKKRFFFTLPDWKKVFDFIKAKSQKFDGFVIIQESDSLIIGASLLNFLTVEYKKPIIFTASPTPFQSPFGKLAEENLFGALLCAGKDLGETAIFSHGRLIRSTRASRQNIEADYPFISSFIDDLGEVKDKKLSLGIHRVRRNNEKTSFPYKYPQKKIFFFRYIPDSTENAFDGVYKEKIDALIIQSLGYGSLPTQMKKKLEQLYEIDIPVIIIAEYDSPTRKFSLDADEEFRNTSNILLVKNMTIFSTLIKTYFVLENFPKKEFQSRMLQNFCGDIPL